MVQRETKTVEEVVEEVKVWINSVEEKLRDAPTMNNTDTKHIKKVQVFYQVCVFP